jgi:activating signal cointegrator 1
MSDFPIISLWQPYASLIFAGAKLHETRGYPPPLKYVGGFIGIHATAKFPPLKLISEELHELCMDVFGCSYNYTLPQGAILGVVRLSDGLETNNISPANERDFAAGDWAPNRFAWPLSDITKFETPIPAKGKQGWWKYAISHPPENIEPGAS